MDATNNPYQTPTGHLATDDQGFGEIKFFSPGIRLGRLRYLAHGFLLMVGTVVALILISAVLGVVVGLSGNDVSESMWIFMSLAGLFYVAIIVISIILMIQRLHDLNHSGWMCLLVFVPLLGFLFALYILFAPGTRGRNDYGLPPPPNQTWHWIVGLAGPVFGVLAMVGILAAVAIPAYQDYQDRAQGSEYSTEYEGTYEDEYTDKYDYTDSEETE